MLTLGKVNLNANSVPVKEENKTDMVSALLYPGGSRRGQHLT